LLLQLPGGEFASVSGKNLPWSEFLHQDPLLELLVVGISQVEHKRPRFLSVLLRGLVKDSQLLFESESALSGPAAFLLEVPLLGYATQLMIIIFTEPESQVISEDLNKLSSESISALNAS
jgi:hypothetical protein